MGSSTVTESFEKGNGMMKPSQLFIRKHRENFACIGTIGVAVSCASETAPGPREYRGPRGPSGVTAMSRPSLTLSTSSSNARAPRPRARSTHGAHTELANELGKDLAVTARTCQHSDTFSSFSRIMPKERQSDVQNAATYGFSVPGLRRLR
jgi:hypothetical protein